MLSEDLSFNAEEDNILHKYNQFAYLLSFIFICGFLFDILFSHIATVIYYLDFVNILISVTSVILFYFNRIHINSVFKYQIIGLLVNMIISHFINPVDAADFLGIFLRNSITLGMLVPIYGLFCGKKYILHIVFVYLFLYVSSLIRVHNLFLINNAPFLMLNGIIYTWAVYYILDILEKMRIRQLQLTNNLESQKEQLVMRNKDLENKNEHINQQSKDLKELNATKDKLFSIIAHDLRSPFNSILGLTELLRDNIRTYNAEKSTEYLSLINSTAERTLVLLDNLLVWAKLQTKQIDFTPQKLKLKPVVQGVIALLESSATIKTIALSYEQPEDIVIEADSNMLQTILRNLIQNAIKFTGSGGKVDISAIIHGNYVDISVSDNGIGMDDHIKKELFREDLHFNPGSTVHERGSGLGLILCKEFVKMHGGMIRAESESGKGSRFTFTLPINISSNKY
ncbi:MAG TPA: HAMP domain-containing sensor histidine kinase [Bacteroidales bacterium]|nr:HAMP domain-containing sensor histidine kinase [Bacteroidales bacterium]